MSIADIKQTAEHKMPDRSRPSRSNCRRSAPAAPTPAARPGAVEYYGSQVPISQVANVTLIDARTIGVQPWEKGMGAKIEKAIRESAGLNRLRRATGARADAPLTEERRKELTKVCATPVKKQGGGAQPAPRCQRAPEEAAQDKLATEDDERRAQDEVQKLTTNHRRGRRLVHGKEAEILAV